MKKRTFVCFLIFTLCVFHSALPGTVFGQAASLAEQVLEKYSDILQREDIQEILPAVLEGLKAPNIQALLNPGTITLVVTQPDLLTQFVPGIDPAFITLLKTDAELKTMLSDAQVQALLQDASAIDELINTLNAGELPPSLPDLEEVEPAHVYPDSSLSAGAGETLTVNINIAGGSGVAGYELTVAFDTSALTYVSAANATYLPTGAFAPAPRVSGNRVTLTAAAGSAATKGGGTLATVTFRVAAVKASTLRLQNVTLSDIDGENLAVRAWTNSVSVVRSSGAAWDVNQDGTVNVSDLVLVARHLGSSSPANPRVDVNQDGSVNVSDLVLVARHLGEEGEEGDSKVQITPKIWDSF